MRLCPNCGGDNNSSDRFCTHCGYLLPQTPAGTAAPSTAGPAASTPPQQQASAPPVQPGPPAAPRGAYAAQAPYDQPTTGANGYAQGGYAPTQYAPTNDASAAPDYVQRGVGGGNLPLPRVQQMPTPVAPARGSDPFMNTLMDLGRSALSADTRGLVRLAIVLFVVVVAVWAAAHIIAWFFSLLPWLLVIAVILLAVQWQRRGRRGRRLP